MALGGESNTLALSSMECFTLGYDGWRCSIPLAVTLSGIPEPAQVQYTPSTLFLSPFYIENLLFFTV